MEIEIRKLAPAMAEEYVRFFDVTPHDVNVDEQKCYCVTWRSDASYANAGHWFPTREERRARAIEFVQNGWLQGYLAYCGERIVGWCNANADCRMGLDYLRAFWPLEETDASVRVKSVFCFVVAPDVQRQGVATKLLERVIEDAAADGFDFVEAYVHKEYVHENHDFRGPLAMFLKCGFDICAERDGKVVVRKALK